MKKCSVCQIEKPLNEYYKHARKPLGIRNECKECTKKSHAKYRVENRETILAHLAEYRRENRDKIRNRDTEYRELNRDACIARTVVWQQANREQYLAKRRKYYAENIEIEREKRREYAKNNPHIIVAKEQRRRARKRNLISDFTDTQWNECLSFFEHACVYCGAMDEKLQQEHFIPVAQGGHYTAFNIIPACSRCNASKGDRDFQGWYPKQSYYDEQRESSIYAYFDLIVAEGGDRSGLREQSLA